MPRVKKENNNSKELLKELNIKKEDLIVEIKEEIKEDLFDEISNKIDYEAKNKLDKMEKRIYKYKNNSIIKRNILILILIVIIVFETKILYDNNLLFDLNKNVTKEENNTSLNVDSSTNENKDIDDEDNKEEDKDTEWYIENYGYLLDNIETNLTGDDKYYLYENDYNIDSIDNSVKLNIAYQLLEDEINKEDSVIKIDEEDLKNAYKKVFGNLESYKAQNFNNSCIQFIYNKDYKNYMAIDTDCEENNEKIFRSIKDIYEEDNKLIIEVFVGLLNQENNVLSTIDKKENYDYSEDNINKLPLYQFVFKKSEDNYYLNKIKKGE